MSMQPARIDRQSRITIELGDRGYDILIGIGLLGDAQSWTGLPQSARALIVTNDVVGPLHARALMDQLAAVHGKVDCLELPDGEAHKDWQTLNLIFDRLLTAVSDRKTVLYALGGGVVGDMTGFAAACYMRGIPFVQVPTTLLAQVDSSVGGKTAINHPLGKNMIGAFYQPQLVLADTDTLTTLPDCELRAGLAEVIKYGLIRDLPFFEWIEIELDRLLSREPAALAEAIYRSCRNKAEVVVADERESGERALLNLGHTFGHAIETGMGYGQWLHGEAIAAGTLMAAQLSAQLGWIGQQDVARVERLLQRAGLPVRGPVLEVERYLDLMQQDKKVQDGKLRLVLLKRIGEAVLTDEAPASEVRRAIAARVARA